MPRSLILVLALAALGVLAWAQQGDLRFAASQKEIDPQFVPNSLTTILAATVYVNEITLTNESASDATCYAVDVTNGRSIIGSSTAPLTVATGTTFVIDFKGRKAPGGVKWACSAANAVTGYIMYTTGRY